MCKKQEISNVVNESDKNTLGEKQYAIAQKDFKSLAGVVVNMQNEMKNERKNIWSVLLGYTKEKYEAQDNELDDI